MPAAEPIAVRTLTDGGQSAADIAAAIAQFVGAARERLELALYDVRLPGPLGDQVAGALRDAAGRGVAIRLAYNGEDAPRAPVPPPPRTQPDLIEALPLPTRAIPGEPDLMHHKYVVRDGATVWTGSTNWTQDSWEREENVVVVVESAEIAADYGRDFDQLWESRRVAGSGDVPPRDVTVGRARVRAWFCPGQGEELSHRIAAAAGRARRRIRIASPVITAAPIIGTLAQVASDRRVDLAGIVDATQIAQVFEQWEANGNAAWKVPLLERILTLAPFAGKRSTPYAPGSVHDYMHAKVTVADDTVFMGSFNLSHSGELNAENVLEIHDPALAEEMAGFVDSLRGRYPALRGAAALSGRP